jgi:hypothetical protein
LLRYVREQQMLDPGKLADLRSTDVLPQSVYSLIQSRLARLSEPARRVLDWGMTWNSPLETGGVLVGEEITISIELEIVQVSEQPAEAVA